jgi:hypothetical protein
MAAIERHAVLSAIEDAEAAGTRAEVLDISLRNVQYRLHECGVASERRAASRVPTGGWLDRPSAGISIARDPTGLGVVSRGQRVSDALMPTSTTSIALAL